MGKRRVLFKVLAALEDSAFLYRLGVRPFFNCQAEYR